MRSREEIDRMVREEVAACGDADAAREARREILEEDKADRLLRHARERRGTPLPDEEG